MFNKIKINLRIFLYHFSTECITNFVINIYDSLLKSELLI